MSGTLDEAAVAIRADFTRFLADVRAGGADAARLFRSGFEGGPSPDPLPDLEDRASDEARRAAEEAARRFRDGFENGGGGGAPDPLRGLEEQSRQTGSEAGEAGGSSFVGSLGERLGAAGEGDIGGALSGLGEALGAAGPWGAAAATAAGIFTAAFGVSIGEALNLESANAKLGVQLGITTQEAGKYGKIAGQLYSQNYGESIEDINDTIQAAIQNIGGFSGAADPALQSTVKYAQDLSSAFGVDIADSTRDAGNLIKNGLATNSTDAFNIITAGLQSGANKADDFLETLEEYPVQLTKLGLSGQQATGLITQGLQNGARDSDIVADALKEFSIRAVDGSTSTAAGFKAIGLNASDAATAIGKGGASATGELQKTLDGLRAIQDPVKRSQAAVMLFGTQAEDLGNALYSLNPATAVQALGDVGDAATRMDSALGETAQARIESFKRTISVGFTNAAGGLLSFFAEVTTAAGPGLQKIEAYAKGVSGAAQLIFGAFTGAGSDADLGPLSQFENIFIDVGARARTFADQIVSSFSSIHLDELGKAFSGLKDAVLPVLLQIGQAIQTQVGPLVSSLGGYFTAAAAVIGPVLGAIAASISVTVSAIVRIWNSGFGQGLAQVVIAVFQVIIGVITGAVQIITGVFNIIAGLFTGDWAKVFLGAQQIFTGVWTTIQAVIIGALNIVVGVLRADLGTIVGIFGPTFQALLNITQGVWPGIRDLISGALNFILGSLISFGNRLIAIFTAAWAFLTSSTRSAWNTYRDTVAGAINVTIGFVQSIPGRISSVLSGLGGLLIGAGRAVINGLESGIRAGIGALDGLTGGIPSRIISGLGNVGSILSSAGRSVIDGFINGIQSAFGRVRSTLGNLTSMLPSWKGPQSRDATILRDAGELVISGFIDGLESQYGAAFRSLDGFTNQIGATRVLVPAGVLSSVGSATTAAGRGVPNQAGAVTQAGGRTLQVTTYGPDMNAVLDGVAQLEAREQVLYGGS